MFRRQKFNIVLPVYPSASTSLSKPAERIYMKLDNGQFYENYPVINFQFRLYNCNNLPVFT